MKKKENLITTLAIILFMIICLTIQEDFSDALFNTGRITSIAENIKMGVLYPFPTYYSMFEYAGYAAPLFYGDIFLIPAALLYLLIGKYSISIYIYCVLLFVSCYFSAKYVFNKINPNNSFKNALFSLAYSLSPYFLIRVTIAMAFSGALAMIFTPLCLYGFYECVTSNNFNLNKVIKLCIPMVCLILSHLISTVLMICFLFGWFVILIIKKKIRVHHFKNLIVAAIFTILITAYFWAPLIEQLFAYTNKMSVNKNHNLLSYTLSEWPRTLDWYILEDTFIKGPYLLIIPMFIVVSRILLLKNEKVKEHDCILFLIIFIWFLQSFVPFLKLIEPVFGFIQASHRMNVIMNFIELVYIYFICEEIHPKLAEIIGLLQISAFALFVLLSFNDLTHNSFFHERYMDAFVYNQKEALCHTACLDDDSSVIYGMGEYLPDNFSASYYTLTDFEEKYGYRLDRNETILYIEPTVKGNIEIPIVYQYGYTVKQDDKILELYQSDNGLLEIYVDSYSKIKVKYERTPIQIGSIIVSILSIIAISAGICFRNTKKDHIRAQNVS